ncbi:MAG: hypothetical protein CL569_03040 [Alphaproteobacteria bacterium]|nr:hypothetical protein [Alphaproteobacteria bacterium]
MELIAPLLTFDFALAVVLALAGGFMFGFAGFGGGLIMTPLLAIIYWPTEGVVIANAIPLFAAWQVLPTIRPHIRWREVGPMVIAAIIVSPIGAYFLLVGDPDVIRRVMGIVVLFAAISMLLGWTYKGPRNRLTGFLAGIVGGGMNGYVGLGGPFVSLYFLSAQASSQIQRANILFSMLLIGVLVVVPLAIGGAVGLDTIVRCVALILPYGAALWVGARLFSRTKDQTYRRVALILLMAVGVSATFL